MCFVALPMDLPYTYVCGGCGETCTEYEDNQGTSVCPDCIQLALDLEKGWLDESQTEIEDRTQDKV